jgi:multidrug efflux pump subunit AcrB
MLVVTIPFPGASPEDVERLVTNKLEPKLQGVDKLKKIKSTSAESVANFTLEFHIGFDVDIARVKVREKINETLPELPPDIEDAIITQINFSETPLIYVTLSGDVGPQRLREVAEDLEKDIEAIQGILEVRLAGGLEREIQVRVDPDKLRYYGLSLNQVAAAVERENANIPGGNIELGTTKFLIRSPNDFKSPAEIPAIPVATQGQSTVYLRDVARVVDGYKDVTSYSRFNGKESVSLLVVKRAGENLLRIRQQVFSLVDRYKERYQGQITFAYLNDQGDFVQNLLRDLENNVYSGFLFVFIVLLIWMGLRSALFVATAIPLSFLLGIVLMKWMGFTLNMVVMFSLILALGMLVDNAIVVVENIYRHLSSGKPRIEAAMAGMKEVAIPITTSTLTTLVAFAPIIFMPGIVGQFMKYLPETLIITLSASLFIALVINPVLCATLMRAKRRPGLTDDELDELSVITGTRFMRRYRTVLEWVMNHRAIVLASVVALFFGITMLYGATTLRRKGTEFFPSAEPNWAAVNIETPVGTAIDVSDRYVREAEAVLATHRDALKSTMAAVGQYRSHFGGGESSSATSHLSYVQVDFPHWQEWKQKPSEMIRQLRQELTGVAGAVIKVEKEQRGPPTGSPVNVEIHGEDFATLLDISDRIQREIRDIPGLVNLTDDFDRSRPEIRVLIDREKASRAGLTSKDIAETVRTAFNGRKVSKFREGKDEYDITVRLDERFRQNPMDLERLYVQSGAGTPLVLGSLAQVTTAPALGSIRHVKLNRVITVSADAAEGYSGQVLLRQAQARLKNLELPPGYTLQYTGENEEAAQAQTFLGEAFLIALFLIFLVLVLQFKSIAVPFIIMSTVILSLMGVFIGLMIHDRPFTIIMTGIGVISLAGVVVNNAIVLIDFIQQLQARGFARREATIISSMVRLRPVLLTAGTTVIGLLPIALGLDINFYAWPPMRFGAEGGSFWLPMAVATIYGLSLATMLTLIVIPTLYDVVESAKERIASWFQRPPETPSEESPEEMKKPVLATAKARLRA